VTAPLAPSPSAPVATRVPLAALAVGERLGAGSQGTVHRVAPTGSLDLGFDELIYKRFAAPAVVAGPTLEALARRRLTLAGPGRRLVDDRTTWPLAVVVDDLGNTIGYLMRAVPDAFHQDIVTLASGPQRILREVQQLFLGDELALRNLGEVPTPVERLALARQLAVLLGFLHGQGIVFGDLSYTNAVYALRPRPAVMLLDCDGLRPRGQHAAMAQLHSPGWAPPERGPQTVATDRYKLGLFVLRCITPGVNAQNRDPAAAADALDEEGRRLLARALTGEPGDRPSGGAWVRYLDGAIDRAGGVRLRHGDPPPPPRPRIERRPVRHRGPVRSPALWPASIGVGPGRGTGLGGAVLPGANRPVPAPGVGPRHPASSAGPPTTGVRRADLPTSVRVALWVVGTAIALLVVTTLLGVGAPS
jgi:hypothetical protein